MLPDRSAGHANDCPLVLPLGSDPHRARRAACRALGQILKPERLTISGILLEDEEPHLIILSNTFSSERQSEQYHASTLSDLVTIFLIAANPTTTQARTHRVLGCLLRDRNTRLVNLIRVSPTRRSDAPEFGTRHRECEQEKSLIVSYSHERCSRHPRR